MKSYRELCSLFEKSNKDFLKKNISLIKSDVSERSMCGALAQTILLRIQNNVEYGNYFADVEYNRNNGKIKTIKKNVSDMDVRVISVVCDLILHSRGKCPEQDNLIALEMKKSNRSAKEKNNDRERLACLTKDTYDDVWSYDGRTLPEHVCGYVLGVYYEIDQKKNEILIEYYYKGEKVNSYKKPIK